MIHDCLQDSRFDIFILPCRNVLCWFSFFFVRFSRSKDSTWPLKTFHWGGDWDFDLCNRSTVDGTNQGSRRFWHWTTQYERVPRKFRHLDPLFLWGRRKSVLRVGRVSPCLTSFWRFVSFVFVETVHHDFFLGVYLGRGSFGLRFTSVGLSLRWCSL